MCNLYLCLCLFFIPPPPEVVMEPASADVAECPPPEPTAPLKGASGGLPKLKDAATSAAAVVMTTHPGVPEPADPPSAIPGIKRDKPVRISES